MFGFHKDRDKKRPFPAPIKHLEDESQRQVILVSREDIYAPHGQDKILLLRKGSAIDAASFSKFERYGVHVSQFEVQATGVQMLDESITTESVAFSAHTNPITAAPPKPKKRVLVLDPDAKSLARTTDCLFVCGVELSHIHPLRVARHIEWTLEKYRPQVLVVDYTLNVGTDGLSLLSSVLGNRAWDGVIEQVILTIDFRGRLNHAQEEIIAWAEAHQVSLIPKPVNRFILNDFLIHSS